MMQWEENQDSHKARKRFNFQRSKYIIEKKLRSQFSGRAIKAMNLHGTFNKINVCRQQ